MTKPDYVPRIIEVATKEGGVAVPVIATAGCWVVHLEPHAGGWTGRFNVTHEPSGMAAVSSLDSFCVALDVQAGLHDAAPDWAGMADPRTQDVAAVCRGVVLAQ